MTPILAIMALSIFWRVRCLMAVDTLRLDGSATLCEIEVIRDRLLSLTAQTTGPISIDLSGVEQADITLVQLVLAARTDAADRRRGFGISAWSDAATAAFVRAGVQPGSLAPSLSLAD